MAMLLSACVKDGHDAGDDLKGTGSISGQLSYHDKFNGRGEQRLLPNKKVYLSYIPGDSVNYVYHATTDAQGNFTFKRVYEDREYMLFFADSMNGIHFSKYLTVKASKDSVKIVAENDTLRQNGMLFYVLDNQLQPLKDVDVGLFNNGELFQSDTTNKLSIEQKKSDMYGRVIFYNYKEGRYYLRAKTGSPAGAISADTSFSFRGAGISSDTILMKTTLSLKNTLLVRTVDEAGKLLPGIPFCLYNNPLLFNVESCVPSNRKETSGADGSLKITNIQPGEYYLYAETKVNNTDYRGKLTVTVNASGQTNADIVLKKITPNELVVRAVDEAGNPLPGISVCLFNNPLQFGIESCTGNYKTETTKEDGFAKFNTLTAANYYLYAGFAFNNTEYRGKGMVFVNAAGQTSTDLVLKKIVPANELEITARDLAGTPVNSTKLYFFTSKVLYDADTTLGNVRETSTEQNGKITIQNMPEGRYYIRARVVVGGQVVMKGADSVMVVNSPVRILKTVYVQ